MNLSEMIRKQSEQLLQQKEQLLTNMLDHFGIKTEEIGDRVTLEHYQGQENILVDGKLVLSFLAPEFINQDNLYKLNIKYKEYYKKVVDSTQ